MEWFERTWDSARQTLDELGEDWDDLVNDIALADSEEEENESESTTLISLERSSASRRAVPDKLQPFAGNRRAGQRGRTIRGGRTVQVPTRPLQVPPPGYTPRTELDQSYSNAHEEAVELSTSQLEQNVQAMHMRGEALNQLETRVDRAGTVAAEIRENARLLKEKAGAEKSRGCLLCCC